MSSPLVAIVGAGIAGTACAHALAARDVAVRLFDKGRRAGGRISTRRGEDVTFDHGAQYFTARGPAFESQVRRWADEGVVAPWCGSIVAIDAAREARPVSDTLTRWVGTPTMSAVAAAHTRGLDVTTGLRIVALDRRSEGWTLASEDGATHGPFDAVVLALPAEQAANLIEATPVARPPASTDATSRAAMAHDPADRHGRAALASFARSIAMSPCVAAMLTFDTPTALPFDGAFVEDETLAWVARDSSKPGRPNHRETWVLHATPTFSERFLDGPPDAAGPHMLDALRAVTGRAGLEPSAMQLHRWRYARSADARDVGEHWSANIRLGLCGDWCAGDRIEGAFTSGRRMAEKILADLRR